MYDFTYTPKSSENPQFIDNDKFANLLVKIAEELKDSGDDRKAYLVKYAAIRIESLADDLNNAKTTEFIKEACREFVKEKVKYYMKNQQIESKK